MQTAESELDAACGALLTTPSEGLHEALRNAAELAGGLISAGRIDEKPARHKMELTAERVGVGAYQTQRLIEKGIEAGISHPKFETNANGRKRILRDGTTLFEESPLLPRLFGPVHTLTKSEEEFSDALAQRLIQVGKRCVRREETLGLAHGRMDILYWEDGIPVVIECKTQSSDMYGAIGQLMRYQLNFDVPPYLIIAVPSWYKKGALPTDIHDVCESAGVLLWQVNAVENNQYRQRVIRRLNEERDEEGFNAGNA